MDTENQLTFQFYFMVISMLIMSFNKAKGTLLPSGLDGFGGQISTILI